MDARLLIWVEQQARMGIPNWRDPSPAQGLPPCPKASLTPLHSASRKGR